MRVPLGALAASLALAGCGFMKTTREAQECARACDEEKSDCLLAALTAEKLARCDVAHRACMRPCEEMRRKAP